MKKDKKRMLYPVLTLGSIVSVIVCYLFSKNLIPFHYWILGIVSDLSFFPEVLLNILFFVIGLGISNISLLLLIIGAKSFFLKNNTTNKPGFLLFVFPLIGIGVAFSVVGIRFYLINIMKIIINYFA